MEEGVEVMLQRLQADMGGQSEVWGEAVVEMCHPIGIEVVWKLPSLRETRSDHSHSHLGIEVLWKLPCPRETHPNHSQSHFVIEVVWKLPCLREMRSKHS